MSDNENPYIELIVKVSNAAVGNEILIALLAEMGFESFVEEPDGFSAYIPEEHFDRVSVDRFAEEFHAIEFTFSMTVQKVAHQNWNAVWESNYSPIIIDDLCYIRAPFHDRRVDIPIEIVIEPKMSFGTAHHPTTAQMIRFLLREDFHGKRILDIGTGTGILAILAAIKGASYVLAIDNDEWAYQNCKENTERNHCPQIEVIKGDAHDIHGNDYDMLFANINRNILWQDMSRYGDALKKGGLIFMSGFYLEPDLRMLMQEAQKYGITELAYTQEDEWAAVKGVKGG